MPSEVPDFEPPDNFEFELRNKPKVVHAPRFNRAASLNELSVDKELLAQYQAALDLYGMIATEDAVPANQKAQVLNTVSSILTAIVKNQTELYDSERLKKLESVLISTLKAFPEVQEAFLSAYQQALTDV